MPQDRRDKLDSIDDDKLIFYDTVDYFFFLQKNNSKRGKHFLTAYHDSKTLFCKRRQF